MAFTPTEEALLKQLAAQNAPLLNLASAETTIISKLGATKVTLSDLDAVTAPADADIMLARQGTDDKGLALSLLKEYSQGGAVLTTGDQTVAGVKTFSSSPVVPTATAGDSSTKAASTAFVSGAVADIDEYTDADALAWFESYGKSLTESGYQKLPSGLIIQWGLSGTVTEGTALTVTFPIAFLVNLVGLGQSDSAALHNPPVVWGHNITSLSQIEFHWARSGAGLGTSNTRRCRYIAIGY